MYVGARFLCTNEARALLLRAIVVAALVYSLPMLVEIRISPQLHRLVYGYFPHSFAQQIRDGGYRPVVFLEHGLQVALFASMAVIAALVATRAKWRILHVPAGWVAAYLSVILVLCKTLGALIYAAVLAPVILFTGPRSWTKVACFLLLTVCAYPALRTSGLIPVQRIAGAANSVSGDRALSFLSRVQNEDLLLAKANQKPLFGWGTWGRNRIYDTETGRDLSVTDGTWIIQYGMFGWLGYLSLFGLFAVGAIRAARAVGSQMKSENIILGGLGLVLAANVIDLLPNSDLTPLTFLLAGSIASAVPEKSAKRSARRANQRIGGSGSRPAIGVFPLRRAMLGIGDERITPVQTDPSRLQRHLRQVCPARGFTELDSYYAINRERYFQTLRYLADLKLPEPANVLDVGGGQFAILAAKLFGDEGTIGDVGDAYRAPADAAGVSFTVCNLLEDDPPAFNGVFDADRPGRGHRASANAALCDSEEGPWVAQARRHAAPDDAQPFPPSQRREDGSGAGSVRHLHAAQRRGEPRPPDGIFCQAPGLAHPRGGLHAREDGA